MIALAVVASLLLAIGAWMRSRDERLLMVVAVAMLAFAIFDFGEIGRQLENGEGALVALAALVGLLHFAAGAGAFVRQRNLGESASA